MIKTASVVLAFALVAFLAVTAWRAKAEAGEVREAVVRLEAVRDSALALADGFRAQADSLGQQVDTLLVELGTVRTEAEATVREIEAESDSLGNALKNALDSLGAPDTLKAVVERLVGQSARVRAEYDGLLLRTDSIIGVLRSQVMRKEQEAAGLRLALTAKDQQAAILSAALERAMNPGWLGQLTRDTKAKAGVAVVAFTLGYAMKR